MDTHHAERVYLVGLGVVLVGMGRGGREEGEEEEEGQEEEEEEEEVQPEGSQGDCPETEEGRDQPEYEEGHRLEVRPLLRLVLHLRIAGKLHPIQHRIPVIQHPYNPIELVLPSNVQRSKPAMVCQRT